jgi:hypothetical protein
MTKPISYEIEPYVGVGRINFGDTPEQVRAAIGMNADSFVKGESAYPTDAFDHAGIHVHYRSPGISEAIEMWGPAKPSFEGRKLLGLPYRQLRDWITRLDADVELHDTGLTSQKFGFGLYASSAEKEPDSPVEGVIVFERGYYDRDP